MKKLAIILCLLSASSCKPTRYTKYDHNYGCVKFDVNLTICVTSEQVCFVYSEQAKSECVKK